MTEPSSRLPDDTVKEILAGCEGRVDVTGEWQLHQGGGRPHSPLTDVEVETRGGQVEVAQSAFIQWVWSADRDDGHDVLRYRTVRIHRRPDFADISLALSELLAARKVVEAAEKMAGALAFCATPQNGTKATIARANDALHAYRQALREDMTK